MTNLSTPLIEAAERWPTRTAFRFRGTVLSYGDLYSRARDLSACLMACGVKPGDRVAIAMTKGLDMPIAIHGIWMAGAAFVPLDPSAPVDRLIGILKDCEISVIVSAQSNAALATKLTTDYPATVIGCEIDAVPCRVPDTAPLDFEPHTPATEDLAYIIFTSGSTGLPKGICHTHASGLAFAQAWNATYDLQADDVFFCTVPLHFDFSLADFLTPPIAGAMTELVPEQALLFPASLAEILESSGGTIWSSVPYTFTQLCERGAVNGRDLSCLRWLIYGGEPMPPSALPLLRATFDAKISNSYGPAEVNQVSEYIVPEDHPTNEAIPIGTPLPHSRFHADDAGELLVAAASMMQGYWNRPDLNAAAFTDIDGTRYYRTGDRVEQRDDGFWTFRGREDRQIKLRGNRIELDEVEMALVAHQAISEAAAVLSADGQTLHAFVTLLPGADLSAVDVTQHAASRLPRYAVPGDIRILRRFAKTTTGKINRRALLEEIT